MGDSATVRAAAKLFEFAPHRRPSDQLEPLRGYGRPGALGPDVTGASNLVSGRAFSFRVLYLRAVAALRTVTVQNQTTYTQLIFLWNVYNVQDCGHRRGQIL